MTATVIKDLSTTDRAPATAGRMASAALEFLASLNEMQRRAATLPFGDDRRYIWDYRPPENTPRAQSANPTAAQQGIRGQTPRFESAKPGATQKFTPRR